MIVGSGIDAVEIERIRRALARHGERFARRVFTARERARCEGRRAEAACFARHFAAKEAGMKALGTGWAAGVSWLDLELTEERGRLELALSGAAARAARALGGSRLWVSTAASSTLAVAEVLLEDPSRSAGAD
ncbi:MAG: holo-ACP synthase [Myxococcota bacterium]